MKPKPLPDLDSRNIEEIVILPKKTKKNTKRIMAGTIKVNTRKCLNW